MINPYLAGKTQYGGSSSANAGMTLNPTGYMQRESDRRSQLAQNFMQNQQGQQAPQVGTVTGLTNNFDQRTATGRILPPSTATFQQAPSINVSAPKGQPADLQFNTEAFQYNTDYQNQARQMLEARQGAELEYANQTRGLQQVLDKLPGQLRSEAARRGLLRSTYFSNNLENQSTELGNQIESVLADRNFADKAYTSGLADLSGQYSGLMGLAAQSLAARNAANAGKLGLGIPSGNYKLGAKGDVIKRIQTAIGIPATGTYDQNTVNKVKAWQKANGLPQTGIIDDKSLLVLNGGKSAIVPDSAIGGQINKIVNQPYSSPNVKSAPSITPKPAAKPPTTAPTGGGISIPSGTYRQGYRNPTLVKQIQQLVGAGVDGVWGPKTTAAIKAWQQKHGLVADGIIGPKTIAAMAKG